jgi:hypothetical protein
MQVGATPGAPPDDPLVEDRQRALILGGLSVPGMLSLLVLPSVRLLLPREFQRGAPEDELWLFLFFGCASLPFTLAATVVGLQQPIRSPIPRVLAWTAIVLALAGAAYAFVGWRLTPVGAWAR